MNFFTIIFGEIKIFEGMSPFGVRVSALMSIKISGNWTSAKLMT